MTAIERLKALPESLVHASVRGPLDVRRHAAFIGLRLCMGAAALVGVTLWLAVGGVEGAAQAGALAFACAPLIALILASRRGDLVAASLAGLAGLVGFSLCLAAAEPVYAPAALALLLLAPFEAALADAPRLIWGGLGLALAALVAGWSLAGLGQTGPGWLALLAGALVMAAAASRVIARMAGAARRAQEAQAARCDALVETLDGWLLHTDRTGAVLRAQGAGVDALRLTARDAMGRGLFERIHVGDRPAFLKAVSDAAAGGTLARATLRVRAGAQHAPDAVSAPPAFVWTELRASPLADAQGEALCVLRDASERMEREDAVAQARAQSLQADRARDRFLATISHELRTPLNAIIGFSEMLASERLAPADPARGREYAQVINESGHHLLSVVNAILDVSKMEAGAFALAPEPVAIAPVVDQCCDMVRLKAQEKGVEIARDIPADLPEIVADRRAVKQILINLVSNALKFTPANGRVVVRARPEGASLTLSVIDTGVGVEARDLDRLGAPFFQAQGDYDRRHEGAGLGLSVVRGLVGLHGGTMRFESAPGEGALCLVKLPLDCSVVPETARRAQAPIETLARGPSAMRQARPQDAHMSVQERKKAIA